MCTNIIRKCIAMKKYVGIGLSILILLIGICYVVPYIRERQIQEGIADKVLRFHILANSDNEDDQKLKLAVRDAIGDYLKEDLEKAKDKEDSIRIINEHMDELIEVAEDTVQEYGYDYNVEARILTTHFPQKSYGDITFPEGEYDALEVFIGEGEGHNWWCVLYPNMCFRDSLYEVDEESKVILQSVLTAQEYQSVIDEGKYVVRWKFLEYFK